MNDGTMGAVHWQRCLHTFPAMSRVGQDGIEPFSTPAEWAEGEKDGAFVGYIPDDMEKFIGNVRRAYEERLTVMVSI